MQSGPQGWISLNPNSAVIQEVPEVHLARENVRVYSPPLWTLCCSEGIHKVVEANIGYSQGDRNPLNCIPRRFSNHQEDQERDRRGLSEDKGLDGESWICDKQRQIPEQGYPDD